VRRSHLLVFTLASLILAQPVYGDQPRTMELWSPDPIRQAVLHGGTLFVMYSNGTVAQYAVPSMARLKSVHTSIRQPAALGVYDDRTIAVASGNGTLTLWDMVAERPLLAMNITRGGRLVKAVISGRYVAAVEEVAGASEARQRLLVFDLPRRALVFLLDLAATSPITSFYDVRIVGSRLMAYYSAGGGTARVSVYDIPMYSLIRELKAPVGSADFDGERVIAAGGGEGVVADISSGAEFRFSVNGDIIDARLAGDAYILVKSGGGVAVCRVTGGNVTRLWSAPEGLALGFLGPKPLVAGFSGLYVQEGAVAELGRPMEPLGLTLGDGLTVVNYGWALFASYAVSRVAVTLQVAPGARVRVYPERLEAVAGEDGRVELELVPGVHVVEASAPGGASLMLLSVGASGDYKAESVPGGRAALVLRLRGAITSPPEAHVEVESGGGPVAPPALIRDAGAFVLLTEPGTYNLSVYAGMFEGETTVACPPGQVCVAEVEMRPLSVGVRFEGAQPGDPRLLGPGNYSIPPARLENGSYVFEPLQNGEYALYLGEACAARGAQLFTPSTRGSAAVVHVECRYNETGLSSELASIGRPVTLSPAQLSALTADLSRVAGWRNGLWLAVVYTGGDVSWVMKLGEVAGRMGCGRIAVVYPPSLLSTVDALDLEKQGWIIIRGTSPPSPAPSGLRLALVVREGEVVYAGAVPGPGQGSASLLRLLGDPALGLLALGLLLMAAAILRDLTKKG